jgi:hypothetical protein
MSDQDVKANRIIATPYKIIVFNNTFQFRCLQ